MLRNEGFQVAVFNMRGAEIKQSSNRVYDLAKTTEDLATVIAHIRAKYPQANLYLMGNSLGASFGVQYLARYNVDRHVKGMVSIGNPFDANIMLRDLSRLGKRLYCRYVTRGLINKALFNIDTVEKHASEQGIDIDMSKVKKSTTPLYFDEHFALKLHPYSSLEDYYARLSCVTDLSGVGVPLLVIHSKNDPVSA